MEKDFHQENKKNYSPDYPVLRGKPSEEHPKVDSLSNSEKLNIAKRVLEKKSLSTQGKERGPAPGSRFKGIYKKIRFYWIMRKKMKKSQASEQKNKGVGEKGKSLHPPGVLSKTNSLVPKLESGVITWDLSQTSLLEEKTKSSWTKILNSEFSEEMKEEINRALTKSKWRLGLRKRVVFCYSWVVRILFGLEVSGIENLPEEAPFILASNHSSHLDSLLILAALPQRYRGKFYVVGVREHLKSLAKAFFVWLVQMIPIARGGNFIPALQASKMFLEAGNVLLVFPEGTRSRDGYLNPFKDSVGILSEVTEIPIVPILVEGTYEALPPTRMNLKFSQVKIVFDKPIYPNQLNGDLKRQKYEIITQELKDRILQLGGKVRPL